MPRPSRSQPRADTGVTTAPQAHPYLRRAAALPKNEISEKHFQQQVVSLAKILGWRVYHPYLSIHSERGFPDLTLIRDRVVFAELKTARGKVTEHQEAFIADLTSAGAEVYIWRPDDFGEIERVLRARREEEKRREL